MRGIFMILLILNGLTALAVAQQLSPQEVTNLLSRIHDQRTSAPDVQADFREEKTIHLMSKPIASTGRVWFEAPDKFRRDVRGNSPSITVSDGKRLWIYYPNFKSAEHYSLGKGSPVDAALTAINTALNLENAEKSFEISAIKAGDRYKLQLSPKTSSMKRIFERFDVELDADLLVTRTEMLQPNGDSVITIYSNESRAPILPSIFQYSPPPGTEVTAPLGR